MKVVKSIRDTYNDLLVYYSQLEEFANNVFQAKIIDPHWHYESRIKGLESFALKLETGRYKNPELMDDFFACTIVVENINSLAIAEKLVKKRFKLHKRKPHSINKTLTSSDSFRFDDIRLYLKWSDAPISRKSGLDGLIFEVQIKTYLSHAWGIATHDLTYKTNEKSWPKERIAFQIKAMLEHAEVSIYEAKSISESTSLKKSDRYSEEISTIIKTIQKLWKTKVLPDDTKRLAENVHSLLNNVDLKLENLITIIEDETNDGRGTKTLNLSPYLIIIQSLLNKEEDKMIGYLTGENSSFKIFLPSEITLPAKLDLKKARNGIIYASS